MNRPMPILTPSEQSRTDYRALCPSFRIPCIGIQTAFTISKSRKGCKVLSTTRGYANTTRESKEIIVKMAVPIESASA